MLLGCGYNGCGHVCPTSGDTYLCRECQIKVDTMEAEQEELAQREEATFGTGELQRISSIEMEFWNGFAPIQPRQSPADRLVDGLKDLLYLQACAIRDMGDLLR